MPRQTALAKLNQPRISGIAGRDRLHTQLEKELSDYPVVWVAGPAGAGKTTLVASYIDSRQYPQSGIRLIVVMQTWQHFSITWVWQGRPQ